MGWAVRAADEREFGSARRAGGEVRGAGGRPCWCAFLYGVAARVGPLTQVQIVPNRRDRGTTAPTVMSCIQMCLTPDLPTRELKLKLTRDRRYERRPSGIRL